jgi:hypothetical protein
VCALVENPNGSLRLIGQQHVDVHFSAGARELAGDELTARADLLVGTGHQGMECSFYGCPQRFARDGLGGEH